MNERDQRLRDNALSRAHADAVRHSDDEIARILFRRLARGYGERTSARRAGTTAAHNSNETRCAMATTRCKMRCLGVLNKLKTTIVELKPVIAKNADWPGGAEENAAFWNASPQGEANFGYLPGDQPFRVGAYYYIDMEEAESEWKLREVAEAESQLNVTLDLPWNTDREGPTSAIIKLGIQNVEAWATFQGRVGKTFSVRIVEAGGEHSCPYTS